MKVNVHGIRMQLCYAKSYIKTARCECFAEADADLSERLKGLENSLMDVIKYINERTERGSR